MRGVIVINIYITLLNRYIYQAQNSLFQTDEEFSRNVSLFINISTEEVNTENGGINPYISPSLGPRPEGCIRINTDVQGIYRLLHDIINQGSLYKARFQEDKSCLISSTSAPTVDNVVFV